MAFLHQVTPPSTKCACVDLLRFSLPINIEQGVVLAGPSRSNAGSAARTSELGLAKHEKI